MRGRAVAGSVAVVLALVAGGFLLDSAGARSPPGAAPADAPSGVWFCPHGGGRTGWHVWLSLTNPGSTSVRARVTTFGASRPTAPKQVTVPANGRVQVAVPSLDFQAKGEVEGRRRPEVGDGTLQRVSHPPQPRRVADCQRLTRLG